MIGELVLLMGYVIQRFNKIRDKILTKQKKITFF